MFCSIWARLVYKRLRWCVFTNLPSDEYFKIIVFNFIRRVCSPSALFIFHNFQVLECKHIWGSFESWYHAHRNFNESFNTVDRVDVVIEKLGTSEYFHTKIISNLKKLLCRQRLQQKRVEWRLIKSAKNGRWYLLQKRSRNLGKCNVANRAITINDNKIISRFRVQNISCGPHRTGRRSERGVRHVLPHNCCLRTATPVLNFRGVVRLTRSSLD